MSYLNARLAPADKAKAAVSVIAIHAFMATGVVIGLAVTTDVFTAPDNPTSYFVPVDVPPPPPEAPDIPPENTVVTAPPAAPLPPLDLTRTSPIEVVVARDDFPPITSTIPNVIDAPPTPVAPPLAAYTPTGPVPANAMSRWITTDDYTRSDLLREREGTAQYRLVVGSNGSVDACQITVSTGHATLDRTTCRLIERRARFNPATNSRGEAIVGTYTGAVTWQIPD